MEEEITYLVINGGRLKEDKIFGRFVDYARGNITAVYCEYDLFAGSIWRIDLRHKTKQGTKYYTISFRSNSTPFKDIVDLLLSYDRLCSSTLVTIKSHPIGDRVGVEVIANRKHLRAKNKAREEDISGRVKLLQKLLRRRKTTIK